MQVLLACEPPLLNELLSVALAELPGVELVDAGSARVDVVIASPPGATSSRPAALRRALAPRARLVVLDPVANVLQVWESGREAPSAELLPGTLATLGGLIQQWEGR